MRNRLRETSRPIFGVKTVFGRAACSWWSVAKGNCRRNCRPEIWEKPWIEHISGCFLNIGYTLLSLWMFYKMFSCLNSWQTGWKTYSDVDVSCLVRVWRVQDLRCQGSVNHFFLAKSWNHKVEKKKKSAKKMPLNFLSSWFFRKRLQQIHVFFTNPNHIVVSVSPFYSILITVGKKYPYTVVEISSVLHTTSAL